MKVILQQLGIVIRHFLKVGNEPALVHRVAVEAAGELVVDAAAGHFFERGFRYSEQMFFFGLLVALEQEINRWGMREFWRAAEAAILNVEELRDGLDLGVYNAEVKLRPSAGESLGLRHSFRKGIRGTRKLVSAVAIGIRDGKEDPAEART